MVVQISLYFDYYLWMKITRFWNFFQCELAKEAVGSMCCMQNTLSRSSCLGREKVGINLRNSLYFLSLVPWKHYFFSHSKTSKDRKNRESVAAKKKKIVLDTLEKYYESHFYSRRRWKKKGQFILKTILLHIFTTFNIVLHFALHFFPLVFFSFLLRVRLSFSHHDTKENGNGKTCFWLRLLYASVLSPGR